MFDRVVIKPQSGKYILIYGLKIQFCFPANIYLFKVNTRNTIKIDEMCLELKSDSPLPKKIVLFASMKAF